MRGRLLMKKLILFLLVLIFISNIVGCADKDKVNKTTYTLSITKEGKGSVEPEEGVYRYDEDTIVSLSTIADTADGWFFSKWGGVNGEEVAEDKILINGDKSIVAVFSKSEYSLNVTVIPEDAGRVEVVTLPVLQSIEHGETVRLTATGNTGYLFDHWEGALTGSTNPATWTMDEDKEVTAVFERAIYGRVTGRNSTEGIEGITINFSDGSSTTTDSQGYWVQKGITGTITVIPEVPVNYFGAGFAPINRKVTWPSDDINFTLEGYRFISKWGSEGSGDGQFNNPSGIAVDGLGNIYVVDIYNHQIQVFDNAGNFTCKWGGEGSGDGQFNTPHGIAVDGSGNIYVADTNNHRIQVFDNAGNFTCKWGSEGSGDGQFNNPFGIAVDGSGNIYVADTNNHRIQVFDNAGNFTCKWGSEGSGDGQFNNPSGIAVDSSGNTYVGDSGNRQIKVFDSTGSFICKWGSEGSGDGQFKYPAGIAVDGLSNIYIVDYGNHRIQAFDSTGNFISKWGSEGSADGQFLGPFGVVVDDSGNIYITDAYNHRIQVFAPVD